VALVLALLGIAALAPQADATVSPFLTGTSPASPGTSSEPLIRGNADGVITARYEGPAPFFDANEALSPTATEPGATITIYTALGCTGPVAATGTAADLEGAGIPVTVAPDSETTFYANQTGAGETSSCSNGIVYQQVTSAPAPPTLTGTSPGSPADDNFPRVQGSSAAHSIVSLYADPSCSGNPLASGTAAAFTSPGIEIQVPDNSTTTVHALATLAGVPSACSSPSLSYQEVTPAVTAPGGGGTGDGGAGAGSNGKAKPPAPRLRTVPGTIGNSPSPLLAGSAPQAVVVKIFASADCSGGLLSKVSAAQLSAGVPTPVAVNALTAFSARSVDSDGDQSECSAPVLYTEDSIAPRTRITAGPGVKTVRPTVVFRFTDITAGPETSFRCKLDRRPWKGCHAPLRLKRLGHKRHTLQVKAFDAAGNREKRPVKRSFQVVPKP
jgi:hypothetical protein